MFERFYKKEVPELITKETAKERVIYAVEKLEKDLKENDIVRYTGYGIIRQGFSIDACYKTIRKTIDQMNITDQDKETFKKELRSIIKKSLINTDLENTKQEIKLVFDSMMDTQ